VSPDFINNIDWGALMTSFVEFSNQDPFVVAMQMFFGGGWILFAIALGFGLYDLFLDARQGQFASKWKFMLLAIDIPKNNEQTPKAVENIFAALAGAYSSPNLVDKYWNGKITEAFSFELVSIEGHTRFIIRTPLGFRDLVEAAIYAQYPDAEINEINDYTQFSSEQLDEAGNPIPFASLKFPNQLYDLWGAELVFVKDYPYPIRTYPEFEHQATQTFIDPMASLLEILSRLQPSEQVWLQLVVTPQPVGWGDKAKEVVAKLQGHDYVKPSSGLDPTKLITVPMDAMISAVNSAIGLVGEVKKKEEDQWKMFKMSPGERGVLERIEKKLAKHNFKVKFRLIYFGKKGVFMKGRGLSGVMAAIQQFNSSDANGFKPGKLTKTAADYWRVGKRISKRQNNILRWYSKRSNFYGEKTKDILWMNPEELATIWHFPVMTVKASDVGMIESKKSAPPSRLPYELRATPVTKKEEIVEASNPIIPIEPMAPSLDFSPPVFAPQNNYQAPLPPAIEPIEPPTSLSDLSFQPSVSEVVPNEVASPHRIMPTGITPPPDMGAKKGAPPSNLPFA